MDVRERCEAIEECYEFMLGFAAKGVPSDGTSGQLHQHLQRACAAFDGLAGAYGEALHHEPRFEEFLKVLDRDAADSRVAMEMVLSLPSVSSQVVDNLNALIHLRALLTDLFLIDEVLRTQQAAAR